MPRNEDSPVEALPRVEAEFMSPSELDAALAAAPVVYLPLGTLEFHGPHLPIGLDALTAHGMCVAAARSVGGVVLPSMYQGTGGGHSDYPWTVMMSSADSIRSHLLQTLVRLDAFGVRLAVVFSGHFADEQLALIDQLAHDWNAESDHDLTVFATAVNRCPTSPRPPDHAGAFETSLLHALHPELVHLNRLPPRDSHPARDPGGDQMGSQRHDPAHPLWGIFGPDPRGIDLDASAVLRIAIESWLAREVSDRLQVNLLH